MNVGVLLFYDFETLDAFGPVEVLGRLKELFSVSFYSLSGGLVENTHGVFIMTEKLETIINGIDIFIIPGGFGTRTEINNVQLINDIRTVSSLSKYVLTVCTGSSLLAKTGLLDNRRATSNKKAFDWVTSISNKVNWIKQARWTVDGKYYTSAGVSAGIDMTFGFLSDLHGIELARQLAFEIEYQWCEDKNECNFQNQ